MPTTPHRANSYGLILLLILECCKPVSAGEADIVNERPPVSVEQLQRHWAVDCPALRSRLLSATDPEALSEFTVKQLAQCAIIYQRFPEALPTRCNGYERATAALQTPPFSAETVTQVQRALHCEGGSLPPSE